MMCKGEDFMHQAYKKAAVLAIATLLGWGGIHAYYRYTYDMIYQESTDSLRATYTQVGTSFRLFTQRNWNILSVYEKNIHLLPAEYRTDDRWKVLLGARDQWMYRDFYLFGKSGHFVTDGGRKGQADSFKAVVETVEKEGKPILSSYVSTDGTRRVVFAVPFKKTLTIDGIDYMGIAVSYDNQVVERFITGNIYDGKSDCYVVDEAGNVVLSLTPKSEIPEHVDNILSYLKVHDAAEEKGSLEWMARGIREEQGGSLLISLGERKYYTVYRPLGISHLSLVGLVRDRVVDEGLVRVRNATVFALAAIFSLLAFFMIGVTIKEARQRLHEKEREKKVLASQRDDAGALWRDGAGGGSLRRGQSEDGPVLLWGESAEEISVSGDRLFLFARGETLPCLCRDGGCGVYEDQPAAVQRAPRQRFEFEG